MSPYSILMSERRDPELLGDDLGVGRLVTLALGLGADPGQGLARRVDPDLAAVVHLQTDDVEGVRGSGPDDLGERADADAHQLATGPLLELLLAQVVVADDVHRLAQGGAVVARVVVPAGRGVIRELLGLDEVLQAELGRVLADLVGQDVDHPLDGVDRLGHPERAAVGDAARGLVGVDAVDLDEGVVEVVRPGDDVEQAGRELGRIGRRIRVAVVGQGLHLETGDLAFLRRAELGVDVVVAGERVGLEVLRAVLDPLDRLADGQRGRRWPGRNPGRPGPCPPKPPPMSWVFTRMFCSGRPATRARTVRTTWGAWLVMCRVSWPRTASQSAMQPQVSIEATWIRGM